MRWDLIWHFGWVVFALYCSWRIDRMIEKNKKEALLQDKSSLRR